MTPSKLRSGSGRKAVPLDSALHHLRIAHATIHVSRRGWEQPAAIGTGEDSMKYEKPAVQRLGSLREVTLGAGQNTPGDATNLYHRS